MFFTQMSAEAFATFVQEKTGLVVKIQRSLSGSMKMWARDCPHPEYGTIGIVVEGGGKTFTGAKVMCDPINQVVAIHPDGIFGFFERWRYVRLILSRQ